MRIAVMGAGGVGGYFGARLAQAGHEVSFVARGRHLDAIRAKGLVLQSPLGDATVRVRAAQDPKAYEEWIAFNRHAMYLVEPGLRERLLERHRQVGPLSQLEDLKTIDAFDVRDRIAGLKPKLLLLRGLKDPGKPPEYEKEIHEAVPGSRHTALPIPRAASPRGSICCE